MPIIYLLKYSNMLISSCHYRLNGLIVRLLIHTTVQKRQTGIPYSEYQLFSLFFLLFYSFHTLIAQKFGIRILYQTSSQIKPCINCISFVFSSFSPIYPIFFLKISLNYFPLSQFYRFICHPFSFFFRFKSFSFINQLHHLIRSIQNGRKNNEK